jgi:2-hydroxychromene-2-carboxylate isomerase
MSVDLEFFYDLSSPWTRLAFHNLPGVLQGLDVRVRLRPFLVGGVFNAVNAGVYAARADATSGRMKLSQAWLEEWARLAGVPMNFPSPFHPLKSVHAMRACCVLEDDQDVLRRFSEACFDAYFRAQRNLDDPAVLAAIAGDCGLDGVALVEAATQQPAKDRLRANTQDAIDRGAYGSPSIFVDRAHLYFGNDQLPLVRQRVLMQLAAGRGTVTS